MRRRHGAVNVRRALVRAAAGDYLPRVRRLPFLLSLALLAAACGGTSRHVDPEPATAEGHPLAGWASRAVAVAPVQRLVPGDTLGWARRVGDERAWLTRLDQEIAYALRGRGADGRWLLADSVVARARRNAAHAGDPRRLDALALADPPKPNGLVAAEPAQRIRTLAALTGNAPWVLVPAAVRFVPAEEGRAGGRAVLALSLVDARAARVVWHGRVRSDVADAPGPAVAASLAERVADLVAPVP